MSLHRQLAFLFILILFGTTAIAYGQDSMITPDKTKLVDNSIARIDQAISAQVKLDIDLLAKTEQSVRAERQKLELAITERARAEQNVIIAARLESEFKRSSVPLMQAEGERWGGIRVEASNVAQSKAQEEKAVRDAVTNAEHNRTEIERQVTDRTIKRTKLREQIRIRYQDWHRNPMAASWLELTGAITFVTDDLEIKASVELNSSPRNGALIRYQSLWDRQYNVVPSSTHNPTGTTEQIGWGWYYMWSERNGRATSDKDRIVKIDEPTVAVTIIEDR